MALTKETVVDQITVVENGNVQVREVTRILEDGEVISSTYHRYALEKGADLTSQDPKVAAIANAAWLV
jgi:hypothetical protein